MFLINLAVSSEKLRTEGTEMKLVAMFVMCLLLITSCSNNNEAVTYLKSVAPIIGQLNAADTRAWNTSRLGLAEAIENVELYRRQISLVECPDMCAAFRRDLLASCDSRIVYVHSFENGAEQAVMDSLLEVMSDRHDAYKDTRASLLQNLDLTLNDWDQFKGEAE